MRKLIILCLLIALGSSQFLRDNYSNFDMNRHQQIQPDNFDNNQLDTYSDDNEMFRPVGGNVLACLAEVAGLIKDIMNNVKLLTNGNMFDGIKNIINSIKQVKTACTSSAPIDPEINNTVAQLQQNPPSSAAKVSLLTKLAGQLAKYQLKLFF